MHFAIYMYCFYEIEHDTALYEEVQVSMQLAAGVRRRMQSV